MIPEILLSAILQTLRSEIGSHVEIISVVPVSGGDINQAFKIQTQKDAFFLKYNFANRFPGMFQTEHLGLDLLAGSKTLRIPKVISQGETDKYSWLLLEFIEQGAVTHKFWEDFGTRLADLHQNSNDLFGLEHNNYIGSLHQSNRQHINWFDFFIEERLQKQLKPAYDKGLADKNIIAHFENLYKVLPDIFPTENPSLLHGDLWSGNFLCDDNSRACLIDPAVYYGFREMDIAMSKLFGGFSSSFYEAYNQAFPMAPGWQQRIDICNLYPLLVHVNLFGWSYVGSVKSIVGRYR
ncbi:MAG: fructosamine kinase family protein [Bacteroidales bacterium]